MKQVEITNSWCIGYKGTDLSFFNYYETSKIGIDITVYDDLTVEFMSNKQQVLDRLFVLDIDTFDVPIALSGLDIEPILRIPVYDDNVIVRYADGQPVSEDHVLVGYTEMQNPSKEYFAKKMNWITQKQLVIQLIEGYKPTDYIFSAEITAKKVKKNAPFADFAASLNNQVTPRKKKREEITSFLRYLDIDDGFSIDAEGNIINPFEGSVIIKQLTKNLVINADGEIVENTD